MIIRFILKIVLYHALVSFVIYFFLKGSLIKLYGGWENKYIADSFYYLFYYDPEKYKFSLFGIEFVRNQCWFWEPGILQIFLNILLFIEGFVVKRNKRTIFLLIIAIITTYSTSFSHNLEPINPAPPVIKIFFIIIFSYCVFIKY